MKQLAIIASVLIFWSCEKALFESDASANREAVFDQLWQTMDEKYTFFDLKGIDWDQVGERYRQQIEDGMSDEAFFDLLADMLFELRDGHTNLVSPFDLGRNWKWYLDHPDNFDANTVERHYLGDDHRITGPMRHQMLSDSILYIRYASFGVGLSGEHLNFVLQRAAGAKGVIIDVRSNGGGITNQALALASSFIKEPIDAYTREYKTGPGRDDFSTPEVIRLEPRDNAFTGKVVVLINRRSYSATSFFATSMKYHGHITLMGDSTGGGGGTPQDGELGNGWRFRYSATRTFDREGFPIEPGVAPDVFVNLDPNVPDVDEIIEEAIRLIQ